MQLKELEDRLRGSLPFANVAELEANWVEHDCPVKTHEALVEEHRKGRLVLTPRYVPDIMAHFATPREKLINACFTWSGIGVTVVLLLLTWHFGQPLMLLGIPVAFLGFFVTTPASKSGAPLVILAFLVFVGFCFVHAVPAAIVASYLITDLSSMFSTQQALHKVRELSLSSEVLFIYFYTRRLIRVDLKEPSLAESLGSDEGTKAQEPPDAPPSPKDKPETGS